MKILLIDDDEEILDAVSVGLRLEWRDGVVVTASTADEGLRLFREQAPDVVVLDVTMPDRSGFDVLGEIRRESNVPVILLTARQTESSQVRGLDLGADDYVTKPFGILALLAHIRAVLRRSEAARGSSATVDLSGGLSVDFESHRVYLDGEVVRLTPAEYQLLVYFVRNPGRLLTHDSLIRAVWGANWEATPNDLKALVSRLRTKLQDDPRRPRFIENERGLGYRFLRG